MLLYLFKASFLFLSSFLTLRTSVLYISRSLLPNHQCTHVYIQNKCYTMTSKVLQDILRYIFAFCFKTSFWKRWEYRCENSFSQCMLYMNIWRAMKILFSTNICDCGRDFSNLLCLDNMFHLAIENWF